MTDRIKDFLARNREDGPRLVVDLDVVRENYLGFASALPDTRVFYAVKANPAPEILDLLARLGSCFDTASVGEIEQALAAGATSDHISFGNTIKKENDIARAYALGVRLFAVDCEAEVDKIARAAPGAKVFCRILCDGAGAEWPLSRKFGCAPEMAAGVLERAHELGLVAHGLSFHVGSQQRNPRTWDRALKVSAAIFRDLARLRAAQALMDTAPYADVYARLNPLTGKDRPYRALAREALAVERLAAGHTAVPVRCAGTHAVSRAFRRGRGIAPCGSRCGGRDR